MRSFAIATMLAAALSACGPGLETARSHDPFANAYEAYALTLTMTVMDCGGRSLLGEGGNPPSRPALLIFETPRDAEYVVMRIEYGGWEPITLPRTRLEMGEFRIATAPEEDIDPLFTFQHFFKGRFVNMGGQQMQVKAELVLLQSRHIDGSTPKICTRVERVHGVRIR